MDDHLVRRGLVVLFGQQRSGQVKRDAAFPNLVMPSQLTNARMFSAAPRHLRYVNADTPYAHYPFGLKRCFIAREPTVDDDITKTIVCEEFVFRIQ